MKILILGGYGGTGRLFCRTLLQEIDSNIIIAGRNCLKIEQLMEELKTEFSPERISGKYVDASNRTSLRDAFRNIDFVLVAATTTKYAEIIAEEALKAGIDYLDIYYEQNVYPILEKLKTKIEESGKCFITQAGFHPGLPSVFIRKAASYFDEFNSAVVAFAMNVRIEKADSVYELVDSFSDYKANIFKNGQWKNATYKDSLKIDFGSGFHIKNCYPMDMIEIRGMPEMFHLRNVGVYVAGFNWFVDYILFPLIMLSQIIRKGLLRHFWAQTLVWGINKFSSAEQGIVFLLKATGRKNGSLKEIIFRSKHKSTYDFTIIPVVACLKQYIDDSIKKPGLWMMGHIVDPDKLFNDMENMGIKTQIIITNKNGGRLE